MTDKVFLNIIDDYADSKIWNNEIEKCMNDEDSWFQAPWLFAECYMYRRTFEAFLLRFANISTNVNLCYNFVHIAGAQVI